MIRALVNSGRSDLESSSPTNLELRLPDGRHRLDRGAAALGRGRLDAVPRTVITLIGSGDCTVAIALPA